MNAPTFRKGCRVADGVSGRRGVVVYVGEHILGVKWDDSGIALPAAAEALRKLEQEEK
jgi:hypothetical protein